MWLIICTVVPPPSYCVTIHIHTFGYKWKRLRENGNNSDGHHKVTQYTSSRIQSTERPVFCSSPFVKSKSNSSQRPSKSIVSRWNSSGNCRFCSFVCLFYFLFFVFALIANHKSYWGIIISYTLFPAAAVVVIVVVAVSISHDFFAPHKINSKKIPYTKYKSKKSEN